MIHLHTFCLYYHFICYFHYKLNLLRAWGWKNIWCRARETKKKIFFVFHQVVSMGITHVVARRIIVCKVSALIFMKQMIWPLIKASYISVDLLMVFLSKRPTVMPSSLTIQLFSPSLSTTNCMYILYNRSYQRNYKDIFISFENDTKTKLKMFVKVVFKLIVIHEWMISISKLSKKKWMHFSRQFECGQCSSAIIWTTLKSKSKCNRSLFSTIFLLVISSCHLFVFVFEWGISRYRTDSTHHITSVLLCEFIDLTFKHGMLMNSACLVIVLLIFKCSFIGRIDESTYDKTQ